MTNETVKLRVGVDLGVTGALALYDPRMQRIITVIDMPTCIGNNRKKADAFAIYFILKEFRQLGANAITIEDVHPMHETGVIAAFGMGHSKGVFEGLCASSGLKLTRTSPQAWKKHYGLIGTEKDASRLLAIEKYRGVDKWLTHKKHHNRAEAILLAGMEPK